MRSLALAVSLALLTAACRSESGSDDHQTDSAEQPLTRDQKDSVVAESALPGARRVKGALAARQAADSRTAALDSIQP